MALWLHAQNDALHLKRVERINIAMLLCKHPALQFTQHLGNERLFKWQCGVKGASANSIGLTATKIEPLQSIH